MLHNKLITTSAVPESPALTSSNISSNKPAFIDEKELLTRLPVSRRTLWQWREDGKIPCVRLPGGRRVLFHWPSVEAALLRKQIGGVV